MVQEGSVSCKEGGCSGGFPRSSVGACRGSDGLSGMGWSLQAGGQPRGSQGTPELDTSRGVWGTSVVSRQGHPGAGGV